jgi:hypothetical protein
MSKPATLLEGLCGHALSFGAKGVEIEREDGREWVYMMIGESGVTIANYARRSADAPEVAWKPRWRPKKARPYSHRTSRLDSRSGPPTCLYEKTGQARSIRLLVAPGNLPRLE